MLKGILSCLIVFFCLGCSDLGPSQAREVFVRFDVEFQFDNDPVLLRRDSETLLDGRATTNPVLSLAWSSGLRKLPAGDHTVRFLVTEMGVQKVLAMNAQDDTSSVLIRFDRNSNQITIQHVKGVFMRD